MTTTSKTAWQASLMKHTVHMNVNIGKQKNRNIFALAKIWTAVYQVIGKHDNATPLIEQAIQVRRFGLVVKPLTVDPRIPLTPTNFT